MQDPTPTSYSPLFGKLPEGPLDVIGDTHGEIHALETLLNILGYHKDGSHPDNRRLVFLGDLCDRGADSPAVIALVKSLCETGRAFCILGNHELNTITGKSKDGSAWFFEDRYERDSQKYLFFKTVEPTKKSEILEFLRELPLALERDDLRVVHATWHAPSINSLAAIDKTADQAFFHFDRLVKDQIKTEGLDELARLDTLPYDLEIEGANKPPMLANYAKRELLKQAGNPVRILTSGQEGYADSPFFSSGKYRFTKRLQWWEDYADPATVLIGHYWRSPFNTDTESIGKGGPNLFLNKKPEEWLGKNRNVFCIDYSVGARYNERKVRNSEFIEPATSNHRLAAMRWPEKELVFDCGKVITV